MKSDLQLSLVLYNIRSVYNVGSLFRTADAAGVRGLYLVGETAQPIDRFGRIRDDVAKTALGAESMVAWEYFETIEPLLKKLQEENVTLVALEQDKRSVDYKNYTLSGPTALIVGNEPLGIDKELLEMCTAILEIPMKGEKESLNVSVAAGIAVYRLLDR